MFYSYRTGLRRRPFTRRSLVGRFVGRCLTAAGRRLRPEHFHQAFLCKLPQMLLLYSSPGLSGVYDWSVLQHGLPVADVLCMVEEMS